MSLSNKEQIVATLKASGILISSFKESCEQVVAAERAGNDDLKDQLVANFAVIAGHHGCKVFWAWNSQDAEDVASVIATFDGGTTNSCDDAALVYVGQ